MFLNKYCIKKVGLLFPLLLLSALLHGQQQIPDSLPPLMQEAIADTLQEDTADVPDEEETATGTASSNIYFLQRSTQPNGGGPDSMRWKKLPDTLISGFKADDAFWYVNYVFNKKKKERQPATYDNDAKKSKNSKSEEESGTFMVSPFFQTVLWILIIGGFAAVVILYLANSNVALFRKKNTIIRSDEEMETATENIFEINYQREIDKAVSNGNFRFAVRLMFLRVLKNLSDTKAIQYTPDRTNFDYLMQLQSTAHYADFFKLTRNYEYSWYGHFDIDREKFSWIRRDFEDFDQKLK
jgi:hypothetical protein